MAEANESSLHGGDPPTPVVLVTFRARSDLRWAIQTGLAGAASLVLLQEVPAADRPAAVRSAKALLSWNVPRELSPEEISQLHEGRLVQLLSAGANQVPFADVPESVVVASNVGAYAEPMAEHVLAMALALVKQLPQRHTAMARGEFPQRPPTRSVAGLVCGILGYGGIGKAVAALLRPLGVRIRAINTTGKTNDDVEFIGTLADLDEVLGAADVAVVALPLTNATRGLIGRRELALMKPDAVLINVARGAIVQEQALYEHLQRNPEFTAGIDAWWVEPFGQGEFRTDFPFFDLPNVMGSPHNSALVPGIEAVAARRAAENVARHLRGEPVRGIVRREDYQAE
jgi:phosphoglycerate dehydrogenase-like enzyme